jgi:hypothetical protein
MLWGWARSSSISPRSSWTPGQWELKASGTVGPGATLTNAGTLTLLGATLTASAVVNNGGIVLDPSAMTVASLTGTGSVTIATGGTLEVQGTVSSGETIVFGGAGAYLHSACDTIKVCNQSGEQGHELRGFFIREAA